MGCLLATGRERLLERYDFQTEDSVAGVSEVASAGNYAALLENDADPHYGGTSETVLVFDLTTGAQSTKLGGEQVSCPDYNYDCGSSADGLVLGADGFSAVHTAQYATSALTEHILATDSSGVRTLDTATSTSPTSSAVLSGLALSGDTLTWDHAGTPESAQLH